MRRTRWTAWTLRSLAGLLLLVLLAALAAWLYLRGSLAQLDGERVDAGLHAPVTVARDERGVPEIAGADRLDLAYATGFVHAQERFFQMDLLRRSAAGELAELFGPKALPRDRASRLHRFRARAGQVLDRLGPDDRAFIDRYVAGVNDGLSALSARPFEYALTGTAPRPWTAADSVLVVWAMFLDLQGSQQPHELARGWLREHTDAAQLGFLLPESTQWDAPHDAAQVAPPGMPIPSRAPAWWGNGGQARMLALNEGLDAVGSNNYAIAGSRSVNGAAIVSDDMHLGLQLPNIWYRLALRYPDEQGAQRRIVGVTLPGAPPIMIVASNGHVAWAFTNSYGDYLDFVALGADTAHPGQVRVPAGWETPARHVERILVKGQPAVEMEVRETSLGPVVKADGKAYALHWIAHDPAAINLNHRKLEAAASVDEALAIANTDGIPAQNFVAGDDRGNIGWTIAGILPRRETPATVATFPLDGQTTWQGLLPPADYPRVVNPADGQLSTANSRQLMGEGGQKIGDGGFDLGARNRQLREDLLALGPKVDVQAAFGAALDDRALFVAPWRERALRALDAQALQGHPQRAEFRRLLDTGWDGHASVSSVGYRLARSTMWAMAELLFGQADRQMKQLDPKASVTMATTRWPVVLERLLNERPASWLPRGYSDWHAFELAGIDRVIAQLTADGKSLSAASWGARNTVAIAHPISMAAPFLKPWLAAPPDQLPGDSNMPRVAAPTFGQSERMTVSPGHEEQGIFNMPGGQSGHPLSPFFLAGHEDWVRAKPQPLLPGPAKYTLTFKP
ncbi:penicillin acylase family protein [Massilia agilis]|uniref:Penicillin acylase family protein n=1 Tax=Massilia agilis TaxID=1811226 RepID=A0ABT2DD30_9BURK|nr:penicillin acylase family protein [Massilia agilis]MCS0808338.1 penicillin acylase family protein [Massilia agilis]